MPTATLPDTHCAQCSLPVAADSLVALAEGDRVCQDCVTELSFCDGCATPARTTSYTVANTALCGGCSAGWYRCERCDLFTGEIVAIIDGPDVCGSCAREFERCDDCGAYARHTETVQSGDDVCSTCRHEDYHYCEDCYTLVPLDDQHCESCYDEDRGHELVHDYSYTPTPLFHGHGPLFLGMELELITPYSRYNDAVVLAVAELGDLGYLKEDGSIHPTGYELVTHPMSWEYARTRFPWQLLNKLRLLGCRTDTTVGIHVHVSRAGFDSPAHVYRWLKFVYRNESQVTTLARRRSHDWAEFSAHARSRACEYAKGSRHGWGRYQAINVNPAHTFELRVFASSLHPRQVKAALAFAAASVEYTRTLTAAQVARQRGWEWSAFTAWLTTRPDYADLLTELEVLACAC
ncbi:MULTISPECIES: hypothetical protein [Nocardia]|uniref:hypothetical protein n=1 Tax=Nocardia TaxID=1817 RepID=UPI001E5C8985|nr:MULTISPECIES: hypothetical protein [Nocardia]